MTIIVVGPQFGDEGKGKITDFLAERDEKLKPLLEKLLPEQKKVLQNPQQYIGKAVQKTELICEYWKQKIVAGKR